MRVTLIFGLSLLIAGLVLIPLPGPGVLVMLLGTFLVVAGGVSWVAARITSDGVRSRQRS